MLHLNIRNHESRFANLSRAPLFVNDMDLKSTEGREKLQSMIYTKYEGDALSVLPSCECGVEYGNYKLGVVCSECNSVVISSTERKIESVLWMRVPNGVHAFVNPVIWNMLTERFTPSGVNLVEWICNPLSQIPSHKVAVLKRLDGFDFPRGFNAFVEHFDAIFEMLIQVCQNEDNRRRMDDLRAFVHQFRNDIFTKYLPMPSKIGFILETNSVAKFGDLASAPAIDAMKTIASIENSVKPLNQKSKELRVLKANMMLAEFYSHFSGEIISPKKGVLRQHVYGGRLHFTMRAVITSLTEPHRFDEIHAPWGHSIQTFKVHLTNKLLRRGFTPIQIQRLLLHAVNNYNPLIDEIFKEIIKEAGPRGFPAVLQRNPSLERGSAQLVYITCVKPNPHIRSISVGALILVAFNADLTDNMTQIRRTTCPYSNTSHVVHKTNSSFFARSSMAIVH